MIPEVRWRKRIKIFYRTLRPFFRSSFVEFRQVVAGIKSKLSQPIRGLGSNLRFPPKNTNLVEFVEILLPVKFCGIQFSGSRDKVEIVSANQRQGRSSFFPIGPTNTSLIKEVENMIAESAHNVVLTLILGRDVELIIFNVETTSLNFKRRENNRFSTLFQRLNITLKQRQNSTLKQFGSGALKMGGCTNNEYTSSKISYRAYNRCLPM